VDVAEHKGAGTARCAVTGQTGNLVSFILTPVYVDATDGVVYAAADGMKRPGGTGAINMALDATFACALLALNARSIAAGKRAAITAARPDACRSAGFISPEWTDDIFEAIVLRMFGAARR
jgi:hypothetical protein